MLLRAEQSRAEQSRADAFGQRRVLEEDRKSVV